MLRNKQNITSYTFAYVCTDITIIKEETISIGEDKRKVLKRGGANIDRL